MPTARAEIVLVGPPERLPAWELIRLDGEPEELWTAAADHYRPLGFDGEIPRSETGRLVGAADRLDTLAGRFGNHHHGRPQ